MDIRTLVLGLGVFCATFLVGWWLNISALVYGTGAPQAQPATVAAATTTGQSTQRPQMAVYVPVPSTPSKAPAPKVAAPKAPQMNSLPQVKSAQVKDLPPQNSQAMPTPRRSSIRIRRR